MLLPCPECNYRCSQSAKACPSCGHPFKEGELRAPGLVRVKLLTILALAVLLGAIVMLVMGLIQFQPYSVPPESTGGFSGRVMALEFVQTPSQANVILGDATSPNRAAMRNQIYVDFVWIVCYLALFLLVANFLRRRRCPWAYYLSWLATIVALGAAAFDVKENLGMLQLVYLPEFAQRVISDWQIRDAAIVKWTLSFVTMALLSLFFFGLDHRLNRIGFFFALTALAGFIGLWYKPLLGLLVPAPLLIGTALLAYTAWRFPEPFLREEHPMWEKLTFWSSGRKFFPWT